MRLLAFLTLLLPLACNAANAEYLKIYLMQPKTTILNKMDGVDEMDRYVKEVEVTINQKLAALTTKPTWGFLVMAVREDGKIKAWVDTDDEVSPEVANIMKTVAEGTKAFSVKNGAVVFTLGFGIDGAALPENKMPFPNEWKKVAQCDNEDCKDLDTEAIVLKSW
ncbi:MAG TPA: hypothetical protein PL133_11050 [Methylophilaceae bacterium]|nr:hypothetical protein [Methylophilaceae bacterium]HPX89795.1 hypothetical protein [Methylophilaceae bacterium]HQO17156.1 hypothetical protein [Methylotenera sp.]